ncbi:unnamed protein product [Ceutorhynchus assimilis]|uniref:Uncharacterized protein n=1 Tax=Ceutorhynchus assimilis TaxID=467358 RepID=A0A9N9MVX3_9CUCU|nr:unnamed protein product [Ceutorhynchus assimilis]
MSDLRPNAGNTQAVTVRIRKQETEQILKKPFIQTGLSRSRIEERLNVPRCSKCWTYDHLKDNCTKPERKKMYLRCRKDGEKTATPHQHAKKSMPLMPKRRAYRRALAQVRKETRYSNKAKGK